MAAEKEESRSQNWMSPKQRSGDIGCKAKRCMISVDPESKEAFSVPIFISVSTPKAQRCQTERSRPDSPFQPLRAFISTSSFSHQPDS